jgi:hypothetical protein
MIIGLDKFAAHFAGYQDRYILIGGAATWLVLDEAGIEPRATKDLDIVLCLEVLDPEFGATFWEFIKAGEYELQEKSDGSKSFYRFQKLAQPGYPVMLELFSRTPDISILGEDSQLTPIPIGEDISSLSAILLDENYYDFIHQHKREIAGIAIVGEECLIPLKASAWLDLTKRKANGENVDSRDIKKHRTDVLRLYQLLPPDLNIALPKSIQDDLGEFLEAIEPELDQQLLKSIGLQGVSVAEVFQTIETVYGITSK